MYKFVVIASNDLGQSDEAEIWISTKQIDSIGEFTYKTAIGLRAQYFVLNDKYKITLF